MNRSKIEWCDYTWNPLTGCTRGCSYCYARRMAYRLKGRCGYPEDEPFKPTFHADRLLEPLQVKKPSKIFTVSMGEFFDPEVPDLWRDLVYRVMAEARQHTFIVLTKQPHLMNLNDDEYVPPNLWAGISLDGQTTLTSSSYDLEVNAQAARVVFVSCEPLLGPIELPEYTSIQWLIIGAQTGPGARQPRWEWVHSLLLQAEELEIPVFIKDNLEWKGSAARPQEWPEVLA